MQVTVCEQGQCAGCMACVDVCSKDAIKIEDSIEHMNALIDSARCIDCGLCHSVCQSNHPAELLSTVESWQGWAAPEVRRGSSSGGFASAILSAFVDGGGAVAACRLKRGVFGFSIAFTRDELAGFAGSKYVKSNPVGIYRKVLGLLCDGRDVLFVGLPCQISAMRNYVCLKGKNASGSLYTIDLICHGSPSVKILREALLEYGYDLDEIERMWFRSNIDYGLRTESERLVPDGCTDRYTMTFLSSISFTRNCYSCHYATSERVGDLSLGDSWGTDLIDEEASGISLALVQTSKGKQLLEMAGLELRPVDYKNAVANNQQLQHPSLLTKEHNRFFQAWSKSESFRRSVFEAMPGAVLKQEVKCLLSRLGLRKCIR
jgi:coenzyme F420-reducing hydrogenase beta subunit